MIGIQPIRKVCFYNGSTLRGCSLAIIFHEKGEFKERNWPSSLRLSWLEIVLNVFEYLLPVDCKHMFFQDNFMFFGSQLSHSLITEYLKQNRSYHQKLVSGKTNAPEESISLDYDYILSFLILQQGHIWSLSLVVNDNHPLIWSCDTSVYCG